MGWSSTGTFTNEASKTVSAISSATGGISVSASAHGYSDGDFIELVDLGTYDGAYIISNVQTDTFDIVNQLKQDGTFISYVATDSGTCEKGAKDFSGVTAVTDMSLVIDANNDKIYQSAGTTVELIIDGAICLDPKFETIVLSRTPGADNNALTVNNGILQIGKADLENGYYDYPTGTALIFPLHDTSNYYAYKETWSPFLIQATGQLKWISGLVYSTGNLAWYGSILCASSNCILSSRNVGKPQIRQLSTSCIISGLTTHDCKFTAITNAVSVKNYVPIQSLSAIDLSSSSSANVWYTFYDLVAGLGNDKEVGIKNKAWVRLVNVNKGSDITIQPQTIGSTNQAGICEIREELTLTTQEQSGTKIGDCLVFIRDTDHSKRLAANTYNSNPDYIADRTYSGTTDAVTGVASFSGAEGSILTTCYYRPDGGDVADDVWDSRGNADDKTDIFTVGFAKYGYLSAKNDYELKGNSGVFPSFTLFEDVGITEATSATVAGYTELETLEKIYDRAQQWVTSSNDNMEEASLGSMVVSKSGKAIDFSTKDVYLSSSSTDVFKYTASTSRVDIKINGLSTSSMYNEIKASKVFLSDGINLSDFIITGDLHLNTGANSVLDFSGVIVTGNIYNDDTSHTLTINLSNGSSITAGDAGTGNGETNVRSVVNIEITNVVIGSRVRVDTIDAEGKLSTNLILEEATTTTVSTSVDFSGLDYTAVSIRVRKSSGGTKYLPYESRGTITSSGLSSPVNQIVNPLVDLT